MSPIDVASENSSKAAAARQGLAQSSGSSVLRNQCAATPATPAMKACGLCGQPATKNCSICKSISYCSKVHQTQHWGIHKTICKRLVEHNLSREHQQAATVSFGMRKGPVIRPHENGVMSVPMPGDWAKGLTKSAAAEWLVDCYRMRVDDDFAWGSGRMRGLYHPDCNPSLMALDFFIFAKLATLHCVTPVPFDWLPVIKKAGSLLPFPFEKQGHALVKYKTENYYDALFGQRSLRWTANQVYCTNVMGKHAMSAPFQHLSEDYNQHEDIFSGNPELFYDFGGVAAWRDFIKALTDTRGPAPWTFSPSARRINSTNLPV